MVGPDVRAMARAERGELADLLADLSADEWDAPTLCSEWTVRDVVAHVFSYEELRPFALVRRLAKGPSGANAAGVAELRDRTPAELVALARHHLDPKGLTSGFGGRIGLTDCMIHQQDLRRPLGRPRDIPADRLRVVLDFAKGAPPLRSRPRVKGLTLRATDLDWHSGSGPLVEGPAESLLMAIAGRAGTTAELTGPGVEILAGRT
jgi:uncharacterized protein (TIGR03083 family)